MEKKRHLNFQLRRAMLNRNDREREQAMLQDLTLESFKPHLNETFHISTEDIGVELELTEVETLGASPEPGTRQAFSLVFRGPQEPFLEQSIHTLEHGTLGRLDLFMVPVGQSEGGFIYQAVFT